MHPRMYQKKSPSQKLCKGLIFSDSARTQTWNLLIRSQMLYSIKLRSHFERQKYIIFLNSVWLS